MKIIVKKTEQRKYICPICKCDYGGRAAAEDCRKHGKIIAFLAKKSVKGKVLLAIDPTDSIFGKKHAFFMHKEFRAEDCKFHGKCFNRLQKFKECNINMKPFRAEYPLNKVRVISIDEAVKDMLYKVDNIHCWNDADDQMRMEYFIAIKKHILPRLSQQALEKTAILCIAEDRLAAPLDTINIPYPRETCGSV